MTMQRLNNLPLLALAMKVGVGLGVSARDSGTAPLGGDFGRGGVFRESRSLLGGFLYADYGYGSDDSQNRENSSDYAVRHCKQPTTFTVN